MTRAALRKYLPYANIGFEYEIVFLGGQRVVDGWDLMLPPNEVLMLLHL
jgi:hypothetical protein